MGQDAQLDTDASAWQSKPHSGQVAPRTALGWGIYVIGISSRPVKIGVARSLKKRLGQLQIGCPEPLRAFHEERVEHGAYDIEGIVHRTLKARRLKGEWFDIEATEAAALVKRAAAYVAGTQTAAQQKRVGLLERVRAEHELGRGAEGAVKWFSAARNERSERLSVWHAERAIEKAGPVPFNCFRFAIIEGRDIDLELEPIEPYSAKRARRELAKALNELAKWWRNEMRNRQIEAAG